MCECVRKSASVQVCQRMRNCGERLLPLERGGKRAPCGFFLKYILLGMNAACVSYCDMTSMDSYYSPSTAQGRDHQFRTFPTAESKYSPTFIPGKGQPYAEKSRSPFQQECQSLDGAEESTFSKYQLFMHRPTCKTPPEGGKLHSDSGLNGTLVSCYGECRQDQRETSKQKVCKQRREGCVPERSICSSAKK